MKLTQTQRDKIYNIIYSWIFLNIYSIGKRYEDVIIFNRVDGILFNVTCCMDKIYFDRIFKIKDSKEQISYIGLDRKIYGARQLKYCKNTFIFNELIDMPSKTLKDYYNHVKHQYINYLESPEQFPLESIQVGFYV